jgi:hypothetical protein
MINLVFSYQLNKIKIDGKKKKKREEEEGNKYI